MGVFGEARTIHQKFRFVVEIDGVDSAGFQDCSELSAEFGEMTYFEGGKMIPVKQPTRLTFEDITLSRGAAVGDNDIYDWWKQTGDAAANAGLPSPQFKRNLDIVQYDLNGAELRRWTVYASWCKKFVAGSWDNTSDDPTMESVTLAYDYFDKTYESSGSGGLAL